MRAFPIFAWLLIIGTTPGEAAEEKQPLTGLKLPDAKPWIEKLAKVRTAMKNKQWATASDLLQQALECEENVFVPAGIATSDGTKASMHYTVPGVARLLLNELPSEARAAYVLKHEPKAKALLEKWRDKKDERILIDVVRLYEWTPSSKEAMRRLAVQLLEQKEYTRAALCFSRYLSGTDASKEEALFLLQAVLVFHLTDDNKAKEEAWRHLRAKIQKKGIRWRERNWTLQELEKHVNQIKNPQRDFERSSWPLFGGDARRNRQAETGGMPKWKPVWQAKLTRRKKVEELLAKELKNLRDNKTAVLSEAVPIVVQTIDEKKKLTLVVYRTWGDARGNDLMTGELYWATFQFDHSLESAFDDQLSHPLAKEEILSLLVQHKNWHSSLDLIFANAINGTMSANVVNLHSISDVPFLPSGPFEFRTTKYRRAVQSNVGRSFVLESGKYKWAVGGHSKDPESKGNLLIDQVLLGAPLVIDGTLLTLCQTKDVLSLVALSKHAENLRVKQQISHTYDDVSRSFRRRLHAAHLAFDNGILVAPTNDGGVVGFDLLTLLPNWLYQYEQTEFPIGRAVIQKPKAPPPPWHYCTPMIAENRVVFAAPDDRSHVHCLDLRSGKLIWKVKRAKDLYLAGVIDKKVLLVGESSCRALSLSNGKQLWEVETGLPSGRGIASRDRYYLPLEIGTNSKKPEIVAIDVGTGRITERSIAENGEVPGNLLFHKDRLISQTPLHLKVYPLPKQK